jgi:hypothetical protein
MAKVKTILATLLYAMAIEKGKKIGKKAYTFATPNSKDLSTLETSTVEMSGKNPRIGLMLNGKQITKQAARMMLNNIGLAMGETVEGRALAQTKASLDAVAKWEEKNGSLMAPAEEPKADKKGKDKGKDKAGKIDGFKKKQLKVEVTKKEAKGALSGSFSKKELKPILKSLFSDSKVSTFASLIPAVQDFMTPEEIKAAFPNHF